VLMRAGLSPVSGRRQEPALPACCRWADWAGKCFVKFCWVLGPSCPRAPMPRMAGRWHCSTKSPFSSYFCGPKMFAGKAWAGDITGSGSQIH